MPTATSIADRIRRSFRRIGARIRDRVGFDEDLFNEVARKNR